MCLLIVLTQVFPEYPLVVAANRDEWMARPATAVTVLEREPLRILGGRDEVAGGTWMATNQAGVVAALTNRPPAPGASPAPRSRGELPLHLARHKSAARAAEDFVATIHPADYNRCWLLVGDRSSLHYLDLSDATEAHPTARALTPGIHILENRDLDADSPKSRHVRRRLRGVEQQRGPALVSFLAEVLRDHQIPEDAREQPSPNGFVRPLATEAACVHAGPYGTRSSSIVLVPADEGLQPTVYATETRPCEAQFADVSSLWTVG